MSDSEKLKTELLQGLSALEIPSLSPLATPGELMSVKAYLEKLAAIVDGHIEKLADEVKRSTPALIDDRWFKGILFGGLEGFALYELDSAADELREELRSAHG